jgi:hypothetical protein
MIPTSPTDPLAKRWLDDTAGPNPLRRLTMEQLRYSLLDLTGVEIDAGLLPNESQRDGFVTFAALQVSSEAQVRGFARIAETVATTVPLEELVDCTAFDAACAEALLSDFGRRVFRAPLTAEDQTRYLGIYEAALPLGEEEAMRYVVRALLSSPRFLYRTHAFGERNGTTGYAVAEKLAYFLWSSTPDEELLEAAASGALDDASGRREAALRMLADPRASRTVDAFHRQWLRLDELASLTPDASLFPEFTDDLPDAYEEETLRLAREVFFAEDGTLNALFTTRGSYADETLAGVYGYEGDTDAAEEPRAGILMRGSSLARLSTLRRGEPIYRGAFILNQVLCRDLELPGDLNVELPEADPTSTYRQQLESVTSPDFCNACHSRINPIGFALDSFDALGRYRPTEGGQPIDTAVDIVGLGELDGSYADGPEMLGRLAETDMAGECYSEKWFEFAMGRARHPEQDAAAFDGIVSTFEGEGRDLRALILAIVESPAF